MPLSLKRGSVLKRLLFIIVIATALWTGYWFIATRGARAGFEAWFAARQAEGWQAEYTELRIQGFPNRIDTTFDKPILADPETGLAWDAPFFQIFALTYRPNHIIAVWPKSQRFTTPNAKYDVASKNMRASIVFEADPKLPLARANLVAEAMAITSNNAVTTLDGIQFALTKVETTQQEYRLALNIDGYAPALPSGLTLHSGGTLPRQLDALRADIRVEFSRPWDLSALEQSRPQPTRIKLRLAEAKWGALELALAGQVLIDKNGYPDGSLTLKARNWRDILRLMRDLKFVPESWLSPLEQGLGLAAQLSGNKETLDLPLDFKNGQTKLGPIPLGPAPRIILR